VRSTTYSKRFGIAELASHGSRDVRPFRSPRWWRLLRPSRWRQPGRSQRNPQSMQRARTSRGVSERSVHSRNLETAKPKTRAAFVARVRVMSPAVASRATTCQQRSTTSPVSALRLDRCEGRVGFGQEPVGRQVAQQCQARGVLEPAAIDRGVAARGRPAACSRRSRQTSTGSAARVPPSRSRSGTRLLLSPHGRCG